jgi:RecB family exonuclease
MRISYTQYACYRHCPHQYKLQCVDRIAVPVPAEMHFGAAIHDALNRMYDPRQWEMPSLEQVIEAFIRSWRGREAQVAEERRQLYFEQGVELLRQHYEKHAKPEDSRRTAATELRFSLDLPGGHSVQGRMDRVDVLPDNKLEVVDYKTSRKMPSQDMVDKNDQLAVYRLAADRLYPGFEVTTTLFYLVHDHRMRTVQPPEFLEQTKGDILDAVTSIELEEFEPNPGGYCDWCAYQPQCFLFRTPVEPEHLDIDIGAALHECVEAGLAEKEAKDRKEAAQQLIHSYLDQCQAERVERGGYLAERRRYKRATSWDIARLRDMLEPLGRWEEVTQVSSSAMRGLLRSRDLPGEMKRAIEAAAEYAETKMLRVKSSVGDEDLEETGE